MNGIIVRVIKDKKFGFIRGEDGGDYFFHTSDFNGFFEDLIIDFEESPTSIRVTFDASQSDKGPRAKNVTRLDAGV